MPSIIAKLASIKKKSTHTFTVLRHNPELFNESSAVKFHSPLIPSIANILRPRPTLHLLTDVPKGSDFTSSPYTTSSASTKTTTSETTENSSETTIPTVTAPPSPWTCPPSAVPWPPQICAAPFSTHHRLAPCVHVVRTPFLTPCGSNCAHVFVAAVATTTNSSNNRPASSPCPSSVLTPATPLPPLLPFIVDAPFTCAVCVNEVVEAEAERKRGAFVGLLERNAAALLEGEEGVVAGAHERILAMEMEDERARIVEQLDGRACEAANEKDGHGRVCP